MSTQATKPYCGLEDALEVFAKFVIVYEEKIAKLRNYTDFKVEFPRTSKIFDNKIQHCVKYVKCCDMKNIKTYAKYTLFFAKRIIRLPICAVILETLLLMRLLKQMV